jgi:N-acetylmuramoyl-L-alanine amidase
MRRHPFRFIAITSAIAIVATAGAVSIGGTAKAGVITVRRGDTLWDLSRNYAVDVGRLASANQMRLQDVLPVGRNIAIPAKSQASAAPAPTVKTRSKVATSSTAAASKVAASKVVPSKVAASSTTAAKAAAAKAATAAKAAAAARTAAAAKAAAPAVAASQATSPYTPAQLAQMRSFCVSYRGPGGSTSLPAVLTQHPERLALRPLFVKWSQAYGVSASLIEAIAWQESGWQNDVVSSADARGIGQLLPSTAAFVSGSLLGLNLKLTVASDNIQMMVRFVAYLLKASGGNQCVAVASYYQGFGAFQRVGVLPQSQAYVRSVFNLRPRFS